MSNFYRNNYVIHGEQVKRVINTNDIIAEKMQAIVEEQKQARREELMQKRREAMEAGELDGEPEFTEGLFAEELELEPEPEPQIDYEAQAREQAEQIISEANAQAVMIHDKAVKDADTLREMARQDGYNAGYSDANRQARQELEEGREALADPYPSDDENRDVEGKIEDGEKGVFKVCRNLDGEHRDDHDDELRDARDASG